MYLRTVVTSKMELLGDIDKDAMEVLNVLLEY